MKSMELLKKKKQSGSSSTMLEGSRIAVVSGGNKGIGYSIVKSLCENLQSRSTNEKTIAFTTGNVVYLTARNEEKGKAAVRQLNEEGLHPSFHQLDIESKDSVKQFARFLKSTHGGLDILVNNAGIAYFTNPKTPMEIQARRTFDVNYFGTLNVCNELFPLLRAKSRVVNVSSALGHLSKVNGMEPAASLLRNKLSSDDLTTEELNELANNYIISATNGQTKQDGWSNSAYAVTKVCVSALTRIQQREFEQKRPQDGIIVNSVHPGWVQSDMTGYKGIFTTEEGAEAPVYAALLPDEANTIPKGQFIWRDKTIVDWTDKSSIANKDR